MAGPCRKSYAVGSNMLHMHNKPHLEHVTLLRSAFSRHHVIIFLEINVEILEIQAQYCCVHGASHRAAHCHRSTVYIVVAPLPDVKASVKNSETSALKNEEPNPS